MLRRCLLGGMAMCLSVSVLSAAPGVVKTRDGRTFQGDVVEKQTGVTIISRGGQIMLPQDQVASIQYAGDIQQQYKQRLAALPPDAGAKAHLDLARWLFDQRAYDLALTEVDTAVRLDPNNADARLLKETIERQRYLDQNKPAATPTRPAAAERPVVATTRTTGVLPARKLLTPDQINVVRQHELRPEDQFRVTLANNVVQRYVEYARLSKAEFAALSDQQKALQIIQNGTPEMRQDVKIQTDPSSIADYKRNIQRMVLTGCATMACHGGTNAGNFVLFNPADNDAATYTNFYILTHYAQKVGDAERRMVDRIYPDKSLLAQYGLPQDRAELSHPQAAGYRSMFSGTQDPKYQQLINWIGRSLVAVTDYKLDYTPPQGASPTTAPATPQGAASPANPPAQAPKPAAQPAAQGQARPQEGDAADTVQNAQQRMRPINPGPITIPPVPF